MATGRTSETINAWSRGCGAGKKFYPALMETTEVIRIGPDAFRRNVGLQTGSKTLAMGFQIVLPGEAAAAHRHTNTALRFVVSGGGAYTTSNGEPMVMEPGDLLIQPNWVWHDHVNNSKEPIIWIDALDAGLVNYLDASHFSRRMGRRQTTTLDPWPRRGAPPLRPGAPTESQLRRRRRRAVSLQMAGSTRRIEGAWRARHPTTPTTAYTSNTRTPSTAATRFSTMTCYLQMLQPGQQTRFHRHTGTAMYHSVQGRGVTLVDKTNPVELQWDEHDSYTVPSWRWHAHKNLSQTEPAILFSFTDRPLLEMTGLDREENG